MSNAVVSFDKEKNFVWAGFTMIIIVFFFVHCMQPYLLYFSYKQAVG